VFVRRGFTQIAKRASPLPHGFTLIELLVVVSILTMLAALLLPVLAQSRESARGATCVSNMRQFGVGLRAYVDDYDGLYPMLPLSPPPEVEGEDEEEEEGADVPLLWEEVIEPYLDNEPVYRCPSDPSPVEFFDMSYALNASFVQGLSESALSYPAATILVADRRNTIQNQDQPALFAWWQWQGGLWPPRAAPDPAPAAGRDLALTRHRGRLNFLYADGHVRSSTFPPTWSGDTGIQYWPQRP
jgi:prepilin-type N-terminal cleavage/methylation domain-containing protein/prepilin-type processing-associated H-X9-DG protein